VLSSYSLDRDQELRCRLEREGAVRLTIDQRITVYFHQEGKTDRELLEQALEFSLPHNALTLRVLAEQVRRAGDFGTNRQLTRLAQDNSQ
jgi:hypothetical protein